jgi:ATP/maltotriose-dependent transcriptional regulator MalT
VVNEALEQVAHCTVIDPAVSRLVMMAVGQLAGRHARDPDTLPWIADLPEAPAVVPPEGTSRLAWRGVVRFNTGQFSAAAADLAEVTDRMHRGLQEFSSGTFHSMLARVQWFRGEWALARMNFRLADDLCADSPHPHVLAARALLPIGDGDLASADETIAQAREMLARGPWPEAIDTLTVVGVIRQHAAAPSGAAYGQIRQTVQAVRGGLVRKPVMWALHAGLAAVWAGELDDTRACADLVAQTGDRAPWAPQVAAWLRGLMAEADGDGKAALAQLRLATATAMPEMPLYGAHVHLDHARVAHLMGDRSAAARSLDLAAATYQRLGAAPYLTQVNEIRRTSAVRQVESLTLSDRERDVLTLVTAGMSYAQIARDLFITQSTVSYHLGNIYAKANVSSRHQLTQLVREQPASFGLALS